jgi:ABC-type nitrate/sulfonate/bicarbonate transport system permease component
MTYLKKYKERKDITNAKRPSRSFFLNQITKILITIFVISIILILWEYLINKYDIPKRILPRPTDLLDFFQKEFLTKHSARYKTVLDKSLKSFLDAFLGFILALIIGSTLGILLSKNKLTYTIFFPFLFLLQLIPVPAFAPVIATMLGYGYTTKILIIVLFTIFPITIAVRNAIINIPEEYNYLMHTYGSTRKETLSKLILPSIIPSILSVMKIVCTASIVATIITELPLSVIGGIGKDIYNSFNNQMIPRVWVSVMIISLISLLFFKTISYLEKYINQTYRYGQYTI